MMMAKKLNLFRKFLIFPVPPPRSLNRSWSWGVIGPPNPPPPRNFFSTEVVLQPGEEPSKIRVEKAERVKNLLRDYGFTNTQISTLFNKLPVLFTYNPEKTLLPKLDFFRSIGFSNTDLAGVVSSNPSVLIRNLHNQIIPCYNFLKSFLISDEKVVLLMKRDTTFLLSNIEKDVAPNVAALREAGVPEPRIVFLLWNAPKAMFKFSDKLMASMKKVIEMGFCPSKLSFIRALEVFAVMSESTWERKMEVYRSCGLSDAQFQSAFLSHPYCVSLSDQKIVQSVDFLVKEMGWQPGDVARNPVVLNLSLEKRIVPRCTVMKALQAKGLVRENISLSSLLLPREDVFLVKFVKTYEDVFPGLMNIYLAKKGCQEPKQESQVCSH